MKTKFLGFAAALALLAATSPASANLIVNGSFEDPQIGTWYVNYPGSFPGWSILDNNVDIVAQGYNGPSPAYQGNQYLDLVGFGDTGGIKQEFATTKGQRYLLTFAYGNNPWSTSTAAAAIYVFGSSNLLTDSVIHSGSTTESINWTLYSNTFVANSSLTRLSFDTTLGSNSGGVMLDAVSVSAVPEASTWIMMLIGFAGIGFAAYRRAQKAGPATA